MSAMPEHDKLKEEALEIVETSIENITQKANDLKKESTSLQTKHSVFVFATIVGGVIAPALVTYTPNWYWKLAAIIVTAIVAASASLRTAFKWGDRYGNAALASLALEELASSTRLQIAKIANTVKSEFIYQELLTLNTNALQQMYNTVREHLGKEMAVVAQEIPVPAQAVTQGSTQGAKQLGQG
jgi:hypothetical protein